MFQQTPQALSPEQRSFDVTPAFNRQGNGLLGSPPNQGALGMTTFDPGVLNSTAPASSTTNPDVALIVNALRGGA